MPKHKYFSSDILFNQEFESIEADKGIIRGVKICSEGEAKGHGVFLNANFIRNVTKLGKEHEVGVKARFGHPNMCATALGTYIGRYKNYRTKIEETENDNRHHSVADLYLDETSKNLPRLGNAWDYIMSLAQTAPDMFGNSIVFTPGESDYVKIKNEDGSETKREDATIEVLHATDLVDEPAATDGLFTRFAEEDIAMQATLFLDQHPEIYDLAVNHPEIVETFFKKYESYKQKKIKMANEEIIQVEEKTLLEKIKALFVKEDKEEIIPAKVEDIIPEPVIEAIKVDDVNDKEIITVKDVEIEALNVKLQEKETELTNVKTDLATAYTKLGQMDAASTNLGGPEGKEDGGDAVIEVPFAEDIKKINARLNKPAPGKMMKDPEKVIKRELEDAKKE